MSTTPRTDEVYDRRLAPEKPGITGHELSKQLETELAAMKTRAELAEAGVERLKGYCEQLHTIIDNKLFPSGTDYAKMTARAEKAEADTARMDWLEKEALEDWGIRSINRDAIDAAMKEASQ